MRRALAALTVFAAATAAQAGRAAEGGAALFDNHCAVCHQAGGVGVAGMFPRLSGRAPAIASSPPGRQFLAALVLNGMSGRVTVDNQPILGVMPGFDSLSDADLAAVLTYVSRLGGGGRPAAFKAGDIAAARQAPRQSPAAMAAQRNRLAVDRAFP